MRKCATVLILVLVAAAPTSAAPLDIVDIEGGWLNVFPAANGAINNVAAQGTDTVRWPNPGDPLQSGYNFTPAADIIGAPLGAPLLLGTFQHINQVIFTSITSVEYAFSFTTNGLPNVLNDTFHFDHNETPNPGDDIVTVSSVNLDQLIDVGGDQYFFNLLGFSTDGGMTFSTIFTSPEGGTNTAQLYGRVTAQPIATPEPGTFSLLGAGLAVAGLRRRRRNRMTA